MNRVTASLSIWSETLPPERISGILGFEPDRAVARGMDRVPPRPRPTAFGWHVTCSEKDKVLAGEVMDALIIRIAPITKIINRLRIADSSIVVNFFLHVAPKPTDVSLSISRSAVDAIASMGGDLDIEFFDL